MSVILFRKDLTTEGELYCAKKHFDVCTYRGIIPPNSLVIGRYSVLPYYKELTQDLAINNSYLINSYAEHLFLADIKEWYPYLQHVTPTTWSCVEDIPLYENGPFVIKGATNSRKHEWNTKMFVPDRSLLGNRIANLMGDPLITTQGIIIRKYIPLAKLIDGLNGLPITMEFRLFVLNSKIIAHGFYWSSYIADLDNVPELDLSKDKDAYNVCLDIIDSVSKTDNAPKFYVMDIAKTQEGKWILIELNDAQMSGLSEIDADAFYRGLKLNLK